MRYWSLSNEEVGALKKEVLTTVAETDAWIDANQSGYANSLTYKAAFDSGELTLMFCAVALMRADLGLLKRVLGEVD